MYGNDCRHVQTQNKSNSKTLQEKNATITKKTTGAHTTQTAKRLQERNAASSLKTQRKFARPLGGLDLWDRDYGGLWTMGD